MCGILGIIDKKEEVSEKLVLGLMSLQHRGQDACGLLTMKDNELHHRRVSGSVQDLLNNFDHKKIKGKTGIGHTRYPTIGAGEDIDAQPLFVDSTKKVGMAHNGNLTNYFDLKETLKRKGVFLSTQIDLEPILRIFAYNYEINNDFFQASKEILEKVEGSYSVVGVLGDTGLFAIRDPRGIRPLVLGKKGDSYAFASESVALQTLGYEFVRDIQPGEAILITEDMKIQSKVLIQKNIAHCMFEWIYFARPDSMIEKRAVYKARLALGKALAKKITDKDVDVVIPVPDTARTCAITLAEELGIKYREGLIKNRYVGRTFIMSSQKAREQTVSIKLNPVISAVEGKHVVVVDDSIVRGTTSKRIVKVLRNANPRKITFVSTCPPIKNPCFYGVDFPTKEELIASNKSIEEIREYMGADELIYGSIEDLKEVIKRPLCAACLDGKYPSPITSKQKQLISNDQINNREGCFSCPGKKEIVKKNILLIGSGGREHALAIKISQSQNLGNFYAIPGNPGIKEFAECTDIDLSDNDALVKFAKEKDIDLTVVGPEVPLANGIADIFEDNGLKIFGPRKKAAQFEASKTFAKKFMKKYNIPSGEYEEFTDYEKAKNYIKEKGVPIVIKADGLAAGKGVCVAKDMDEALSFAKECLQENKFGEASSKIIVEEFLEGEEASYHLFVDGSSYKPMVYSQDHKQVFDDDKGPNTGGMGAYSSAPILEGQEKELEEKFVKPFMKGIKEDDVDFRGVLYIGLMKTKDGLKVLEYNCRFGDPETQVILPRLETDLITTMLAVSEGKLDQLELEWNDNYCVCIVGASKGYPEKYEKGKKITGLDKTSDVSIIHAGTKEDGEDILTNGGRVLNIVSSSPNLKQAIDKAYQEIEKIGFEGMHYRKDIGKKALK
jgi:phosphoribosylamine--glycine ligase